VGYPRGDKHGRAFIDINLPVLEPKAKGARDDVPCLVVSVMDVEWSDLSRRAES
jgi:hypothetical protein